MSHGSRGLGQQPARPLDGAMVERCLRALARHAADGDLVALVDLARLRDHIDGHLVDAVANLRAEPLCMSWAEIGAVLGITRQAAAERFAKAGGGARRTGGQPRRLR